MAESTSRVGGPVFRSEEITSADQQSMVGDGTWLHPLTSTGTGTSGITVAEAQGAPFTAVAGRMYPLLGHPIPDPPLPPDIFDADLPTAASAGNGGIVAFSPRNPGAWAINAAPGDTIDIGSPISIDNGHPSYIELISDGDTTWTVRFSVT